MAKSRAGATTTRRRTAAERKAAAAALREEQKRRDRRRALLLQGGIGLVVVLVVVAVTIAVLQRRGDDSTGPTPPGLTSDGAVRFGSSDAPVTLQAVEDFQCPICRSFESSTGGLLQQYRAGDRVAVEYRPIAFLDAQSTTDYSTRALNASMCVLADVGKRDWLKFHTALYDNQPEEGSAGLTDARLQSMAEQAGASGSATGRCISGMRYKSWTEKQTQSAFDDGVSGTPTLFVDGKKLDGFDQATLTKAIKDASSS